MGGLPPELLAKLDADAASRLPGNENENYLVKGERSFVVKKLRGHSAANTELEGKYRRYLADSDLPVAPYIVLDCDSYVLTLNQESYVATLYENGRMAAPSPRVNAEAGKLLAKVHSLGAGDMPARQSWYRKSYIPDSLAAIDDAYAKSKEAFTVQHASTPDFWNGDLPRGIIHGDLQEDNIIVDAADKIVGIIDWEEAAIEPLLLDVAHSAQQLSFERGVCNEELFYAFITAYQSVRMLTDQEKKLFDAALRYTMLVLSVWAHVKKSRGEMNDELFQRVGSYHIASYTIPRVG